MLDKNSFSKLEADFLVGLTNLQGLYDLCILLIVRIGLLIHSHWFIGFSHTIYWVNSLLISSRTLPISSYCTSALFRRETLICSNNMRLH